MEGIVILSLYKSNFKPKQFYYPSNHLFKVYVSADMDGLHLTHTQNSVSECFTSDLDVFGCLRLTFIFLVH